MPSPKPTTTPAASATATSADALADVYADVYAYLLRRRQERAAKAEGTAQQKSGTTPTETAAR